MEGAGSLHRRPALFVFILPVMFQFPRKATFLLGGSCWLLALLCSAPVRAQQPAIGIVMDHSRDSLLHAAGYRYVVENLVKYFSPLTVDEPTFEKNLAAFASLRTKIYALNIFMPGDMKLVGPEVNEAAIMRYVEGVFRRCQRAGIHLIVWGSGGARRVPEGFDKGRARDQFIAIARQVSVVARRYGITLALENLNSTETNFITTVADALQVVKAVDQPNFRLCADIYHMLMERESPEVLMSTRKYLIHCDIAEREGRSAPGVHGENFVPYLTALKKIRYKGIIVLECRWTDIDAELMLARNTLLRQLETVYTQRRN